MRSKKLPPYVQRVVGRNGRVQYRGWAMIDKVRVWTERFDTPEDAYRAAIALRLDTPHIGETLGTAMAGVLEEAGDTCSPGTVSWYKGHFEVLKKTWPETTFLVSITPQAIQQFVRDRLRQEKPRKVSAATVQADLRALHRIFAYAVRRGWIDDNPVAMVSKPKAEKKEMHSFAENELADILSKMAKAGDMEAYGITALLAFTGIRRSEAGRLLIGDANLTTRQLWVRGKTGNRSMPIADDLVPVLCDWIQRRKPDEPLLPGGLRSIDLTFRRWKKTLGDKRFHAHALRHSFATMLVQKGTRVDVVQHLMGHASLQMTLQYFHASAPDALDAVRRLRLLKHEPSQAEDE